MSKISDRDRLADLEARQRRVADEVAQARNALRSKYATAVGDFPVEQLSEREFRDALAQVVRVGGPQAIAALKGLPGPSSAARTKG